MAPSLIDRICGSEFLGSGVADPEPGSGHEWTNLRAGLMPPRGIRLPLSRPFLSLTFWLPLSPSLSPPAPCRTS